MNIYYVVQEKRKDGSILAWVDVCSTNENMLMHAKAEWLNECVIGVNCYGNKRDMAYDIANIINDKE